MSLVCDSSILVKLVLEEPSSSVVRHYVKDSAMKGLAIYTVDMALAEACNALWKHVVIHQDIEMEDAEAALKDLIKFYERVNVLETSDLSMDAFRTACTERLTFYDALYIAAAKTVGATLYTADQKLADSAKKHVYVKSARD